MSSTIQTLIIAVLVLAALGYVGRRAWRTLRPSKQAGCGDGCGCGDAAGTSDDWAKT